MVVFFETDDSRFGLIGPEAIMVREPHICVPHDIADHATASHIHQCVARGESSRQFLVRDASVIPLLGSNRRMAARRH
jgi:hypothetical protein